MAWFNEVCQKTISPEVAAKLLGDPGAPERLDLLGQVAFPRSSFTRAKTVSSPCRRDAFWLPAFPARNSRAGVEEYILLESEPAGGAFRKRRSSFWRASAGEHAAFSALHRASARSWR